MPSSNSSCTIGSYEQNKHHSQMVAAAAIVYVTHTRVRITANDSHQAITLAPRPPLLVVLRFAYSSSYKLKTERKPKSPALVIFLQVTFLSHMVVLSVHTNPLHSLKLKLNAFSVTLNKHLELCRHTNLHISQCMVACIRKGLRKVPNARCIRHH